MWQEADISPQLVDGWSTKLLFTFTIFTVALALITSIKKLEEHGGIL
jgi:hypothetical protein